MHRKSCKVDVNTIKNSNSKNKQKLGYIFKKILKKQYFVNHQTSVLNEEQMRLSGNFYLSPFTHLFEIRWNFLSFYESQKIYTGKIIGLPTSLFFKKTSKKTLNFTNEYTLAFKLARNVNLKNFFMKNSKCEFFITIPQFSEKFHCIKWTSIALKEKVFNLLKYIIFFQISNRCKILHTSNIDRIFFLVHKKNY